MLSIASSGAVGDRVGNKGPFFHAHFFARVSHAGHNGSEKREGGRPKETSFHFDVAGAQKRNSSIRLRNVNVVGQMYLICDKKEENHRVRTRMLGITHRYNFRIYRLRTPIATQLHTCFFLSRFRPKTRPLAAHHKQVGERLDKNRTVNAKATRRLNEDDTARRFGEADIKFLSNSGNSQQVFSPITRPRNVDNKSGEFCVCKWIVFTNTEHIGAISAHQ